MARESYRINTGSSSSSNSGDGQSKTVNSSGGYTLGSVENSNSYDDLLSAYNELIAQKNNTSSSSSSSSSESDAPDTTGWKKMTGAQSLWHGLAEAGESISDPFGWAEKYAEVKQEAKDGKIDIPGIASTGARFVGSLVPGMIGGLMAVPEKQYEAITGANLEESYNGKLNPNKLSNEQRAAQALDSGIDIVSMIPGIGMEGTLAKLGVKGAKTALVGAGEEAAEAAAKQGAKALAGEAAAEQGAKALSKDVAEAVAKQEAKETTEEAVEAAAKQGAKAALGGTAGVVAGQGTKAATGEVVAGQGAEAVAGEAAAAAASGEAAANAAGSTSKKTLSEAIASAKSTAADKIEGVKERAGNAVEDFDINKATDTTVPEKFVLKSKHPFAYGLVAEGASEAGQEAVQSLAEDVRGTEDANGLEQITGKNASAAASKALESAAFGFAGGAVFHTGATAMRYGLDIAKKEAKNYADRKEEANLEHLQNVAATLDSNNSYSDMPDDPSMVDYTARKEESDNPQDNEVASSIVAHMESVKEQKKKIPDGHMSTIVEGSDLYGDWVSVSIGNVITAVVNNKGKEHVLNGIFGNPDKDRWAPYFEKKRVDFEQACKENDFDQAADIANSVLKEKNNSGIYTDIVIIENPMTNFSPKKARLAYFTRSANVTQLPAKMTALLNSDNDGDIVAQAFDPEQIANAKDYFSEKMYSDTGYKSAVDWSDFNLDISGFSDRDIDLLIIDAIANNLDVDEKVQIVTDDRKRDKDDFKIRTMTIREALKYINKNQSESLNENGKDVNKAKRHYNIAVILSTMARGRKGSGPRDIAVIEKHIKLINRDMKIVSRFAESQANQSKQAEAALQATPEVDEPSNGERKEVYVIQPERNNAAFASQAKPAHGYVVNRTEGDYDPQFRQSSSENLGAKGSDDIFDGTNSLRPRSEFERLILANLDMYVNGVHDRTAIKNVFNMLIKAILREHFNLTKFSIGPDMNFSLFNEELANKINDIVERFNNALITDFIDGEGKTETAPSDIMPIPPNASIYTWGEYLSGVLLDDMSLGELLAPVIRLQPEIGDIDGIYEVGSAYFAKRKNVELDENFSSINTGTKGTNTEIPIFLKGMKEGVSSRAGSNERQLRDAIRTWDGVMPESEIDASFYGLEEDKRKRLIDRAKTSDAAKAFHRLSELLGWETMHKNGLWRVDIWKRNKDAHDLMYGSEDDKENAAWNLMFRAHTRDLFDALKSLVEKPSIDRVIAFVNWANYSLNESGNPLFGCVIWTVVSHFEGRGVINYDKEKETIVINPDATEYQIAESAYSSMRWLDDMASSEKPLIEKTDNLDDANKHLYIDSGSNLDWFSWLRVGPKGSIADLGLNQILSRAEAMTSCMDQANAAKSFGEAVELDDFLVGPKNEGNLALSPDVALNLIQTMVDEQFVKIDESVLDLQIVKSFMTVKERYDKGQSTSSAQMQAAAARVSNGQRFISLLDQYTAEIGGSMSAKTFSTFRKYILGTIFGLIDPQTGEKFVIRIEADAENESDLILTQEEIFGVPEGTPITYDMTIKFIKENPQIVTWMKPATVSTANIGGNSTASTFAYKYSLKDHAINVYKSMQNSNLKEARKKAQIKRACAAVENYQLATIASLKDPRNIESLNELTSKSQDARNTLDEFIYYCVFNWYTPGFQKEYDAMISQDVDRRMHEIFELTSDEELVSMLTKAHDEAFARAWSNMNSKATLCGLLTIIDSDLSGEINIGTDLANAAAKYTDSEKERIVTYLNAVVCKKALMSEGIFVDPIEIFKNNFTEEDIINLVKDENGRINDVKKHKILKAWKELNTAKLYEKLDVSDSVLIGSTDCLMLDRRIMYDNETGELKTADEVIKTARDIMQNDYYGIDQSKFVEEIEPKIRRIFNVTGNEQEKAISEFLGTAQKMCALAYFREGARERNVKFDPETFGIYRNIIRDLIPDIIKQIEMLDPHFFDDTQGLGKGVTDSSVLQFPEMNWGDPVTTLVIDYCENDLSNSDTSEAIGNNGIKFYPTAALSVNYYTSCESGQTKTFAEISEIVKQKSKKGKNYKRYVLVDPEGNLPDISGDNEIQVANQGIVLTTDVVDALSKYDIDNLEFTLVDRNNKEECTTGACIDHNPEFLDFMMELVFYSEETRTMQRVKTYHHDMSILRGMVDSATKIPPVRISEDISFKSIWDAYKVFVHDYSRSIRDNASEKGWSGYGKDDGEAINWRKFSYAFAKTMIPCVKVIFKDGSTCSVSIHDIHKKKIKNPLWDERLTTQNEYIDLDNDDNIEAIEMAILSIDEWGAHVLRSADRARDLLEEEDNKNNRNAYGKAVIDSAKDWSSRNRYCKEAVDREFEEDTRRTAQSVIDKIGYLTSPKFENPEILMRSSSLGRLLGNLDDIDPDLYVEPRAFDPVRDGREFKDGTITSDSIESLPRVFDDSDNAEGYLVSRVFSDKDSSNSKAWWLDRKRKTEANTASSIAFKNNKMLADTAIIIDYDKVDRNKIMRLVKNAVKFKVNRIIVSPKVWGELKAAYSARSDWDFDNRATLTKDDFRVIDPYDFYRARKQYYSTPQIGVYEEVGTEDPWKLYLTSPHYGPDGDSLIGVGPNQAKRIEAHYRIDGEYTVHETYGNRLTLLTEVEDLDEAAKLIEWARTVEDDTAEDDDNKSKPKRPKNGDLPDIVYEQTRFDFMSARKNKLDMSDSTILVRMQKFINEHRGEADSRSISKVRQNDVIGIGMTIGRDGQKIYHPIFYSGSVPVHADYVQIESNGSNVIKFRAFKDQVSLSEDEAIKANLKDKNFKAEMFQSLKYDGRVSHKGEEIATNGWLNYQSSKGKTPGELGEENAKLSMFIMLRQRVGYNFFRGINERNIGKYFEDANDDGSVGGFTAIEILRALMPINKTGGVTHRRFWEAVASGTVRLKIPPKEAENAQWLSLCVMHMTKAAINTNMSPLFLFNAHKGDGKKSGKKDEFNVSDWEMLLSNQNYVSVDDVVGFCFMMDNTFCDSFYDSSQTEEEFLKSGKTMNGKGWTRVDNIPGKDPFVATVVATRVEYSDSSENKRISANMSIGDQVNLIHFWRNGPFSCDLPRAISTLRSYFNEIEDSEIRELCGLTEDELYDDIDHDSNSDFFGKFSDPRISLRPSLPYKSYGELSMRNMTRSKQKYFEELRGFRHFYELNTMPEVYGADYEGTTNTERYYQEFSAKTHISDRKMYMRIVLANLNWTPSKDSSAENKIPLAAFEEVHKKMMERLEDHKSPLFQEEINKDSSKVEKRIGLGVIEPKKLHNLCDRLGLDYDEECEIAKKRLDDVEKQLESLTDQAQRRSAHKAINYLKVYYEMDLDLAWVDSSISSAELADAQSKIFDYPTSWREGEANRFKELNDGILDEYLDIKNTARCARSRVDITTPAAQLNRIIINRNRINGDYDSFFNSMVQLRRASAMMSPLIREINILDATNGSLWNMAGNYLGKIGAGPFAHTWKHAIHVDDEVIRATCENDEAKDIIEAYSIAKSIGPDEVSLLEAYIRSDDKSVKDYLKDRGEYAKFSIKGGISKYYKFAMRFGSGSKRYRKVMLKNFLNNFCRYAGQAGLTMLDANGSMPLEVALANAPEKTLLQLFKDPYYAKTAEDALNATLSGTMGQDTCITWFTDRLAHGHKSVQFFGATVGGMPFFKAAVNIGLRQSKRIIIGTSMLNYELVEYAATHPEVFTEGPLARILQASTHMTGEQLFEEFKADKQALQMYANFREAMLVDLCHMSFPAFALLMASCGWVQPPDDDDKYDNYEEWTVFGQRISLMWWANDIIGPIIPLACFYKSSMDGHKNSGALLMSGLTNFINTSPFVTFDQVFEVITDPDSVLQSYEETSEWYADVEGEIDPVDYFMQSGEALALSFAASLVTPKFVYDIDTYLPETEKSYNRVYKTDESGEIVYKADGTPETEKVSFKQAQIRKVARNNFLVGFVCDIASGALFDESKTGYMNHEMPDQIITEPKQIQFMQFMSVYDYDTETMKSDEEQEAVCLAVVTLLDQNEDMSELYEQGFYLDSYTKSAVIAYIWELYQAEVDSWNELVAGGYTDYYVAGDGDYQEGYKTVNELKSAHYDALNYYRYGLYSKLTSDELNQGLIHYTRYNTTYAQDANGEWYATGYKQNMFPFLPFMTAPQENTAGREGSWATLSALDGNGMYDEDGNPYRALTPNSEPEEWPTWDEIVEASGGTSTTQTTSSGSKSYGSSGGGSSRSSRTYANKVSVSKPYATSSTKATYTNGRHYTNSHNVNLSRPNYGNVLDAKKIYDTDLDYLRPDFETKGSRQAYRRSDF